MVINVTTTGRLALAPISTNFIKKQYQQITPRGIIKTYSLLSLSLFRNIANQY